MFLNLQMGNLRYRELDYKGLEHPVDFSICGGSGTSPPRIWRDDRTVFKTCLLAPKVISTSVAELNPGLPRQQVPLHRLGMLFLARALLCPSPISLPLLWGHKFSLLYHEVPGPGGSLDSSVYDWPPICSDDDLARQTPAPISSSPVGWGFSRASLSALRRWQQSLSCPDHKEPL